MVLINAYNNKHIATPPKNNAMPIIIGLGSKHGFSSHAIYCFDFKEFSLSDLLFFILMSGPTGS